MDLTPRLFDPTGSVLTWVQVFGSLTLLVLAIALIAAVIAGGGRGAKNFFRGLAAGAADLVKVSGGHVWAIAQLTWREALRRRALYVFALFGVLFMFAGWFLSDSGNRPADQVKVYVSFVLTVVGWLTLLVMLLLSCWGIPEDIRRRSLHTVVTKPARRSEVVLGRMLGYSLIGTVILAVMGLVGYVWIVRQADGADVEGALVARRPVFAMEDQYAVDPETGRQVLVQRGLQFWDREGRPTDKGLNVGNIWEYRGYIDGASRMFAAYTFDGVTEDVFRDVTLEDAATGERTEGQVLQFESDFEGFRTIKGNMNRGLLIQFTYVNPETGLTAPDPKLIELQEFDGNVHNLPVQFASRDPETGELANYDLMRDFVTDDGRLTVEVRSLDPQQLLGMGRADLFIRPPDGPFELSYLGSIVALWLKMILLVALGVTAGTFVKGPVATLLVFTLLIVGQQAHALMNELVVGVFDPTNLDGSDQGGPIEAAYRILTHMNTVKDLPEGVGTTVIQTLDQGILYLMWALSQVIPDFSAFDTAARTAEGFAIPSSDLAWAALVTLGFLIPCYIVGSLSLRSRELEAK
ncbi:ABC transporter permease [Alienimonas sp. DA493]|uniref:ABC transporter permease n=1 Tax=Alienimonas sp. DA493 TaxID=3373605 RepID=UPI0037552D9B